MLGPSDKHRLVQLDILRAVAVLLVFGRHAVIRPSDAGLLKSLAGVWFRLGWTGVDLFFVLSGFLIGGLLFKELRTRSQLDVGRFLIRRGLKIWPAYYVYVTVVFGVLLVYLRNDSPWHAVSTIWSNYLHIQNYRGIAIGRLLSHTWSLAVEEHFYLALPWLLVLLTARNRTLPLRAIRGFPAIGVGVLIACLVMRLVTIHYMPSTASMMRWATHLRMDSLFMGVLVAYLHHFRPQWLAAVARHRAALVGAAVALIAPMGLFGEDDPFTVTFGFTLIYLGYACLMVATVYTPATAPVFGTALARILGVVGSHSYSIYVWHVLVGRYPLEMVAAVFPLVGIPNTLRWGVFTALYIVWASTAGMLLGSLVEWPALRWRDRLFPARSDAMAMPTEATLHMLVANPAPLLLPPGPPREPEPPPTGR